MGPNQKNRGKPDPANRADAVKRVMEAADLEKIVPFGSAARGEIGLESDIDLMVIKGNKSSGHRVTTTTTEICPARSVLIDVYVNP
jgi:predicted nucleotidyltransferase